MFVKKSFEVAGSKGNLYNVTFSDDSGCLRATCTCRAGTFHQICKHVLSLINSNAEINNMLSDEQRALLNKYLDAQKQSDELKTLVKSAKSDFASSILDDSNKD